MECDRKRMKKKGRRGKESERKEGAKTSNRGDGVPQAIGLIPPCMIQSCLPT